MRTKHPDNERIKRLFDDLLYAAQKKEALDFFRARCPRGQVCESMYKLAEDALDTPPVSKKKISDSYPERIVLKNFQDASEQKNRKENVRLARIVRDSLSRVYKDGFWQVRDGVENQTIEGAKKFLLEQLIREGNLYDELTERQQNFLDLIVDCYNRWRLEQKVIQLNKRNASKGT